MSFYETNLFCFAVISAVLLYRQSRLDETIPTADAERAVKSSLGQDAIKRFKSAYFPAYGLVCAADWLQVRPGC